MSIHNYISSSLAALKDAHRIFETGGSGGLQSQRVGCNLLFGQLHESEEIWSENGVRVPCHPLLNPPLSLKDL